MPSPTDMVVYDSIRSSNIPRGEKSMIRRWFETMNDMVPGRSDGGYYYGGNDTPSRLSEVVNVARSTGENVIVGGLLAYLHTELKTGLDVGKVPVDGTMGAIAKAASILAPGSEVSTDVKNIANSAVSIYCFRKFYDMLAAKKLAEGGTVGGKFGPQQNASIAGEDGDEDPVVAAARNL